MDPLLERLERLLRSNLGGRPSSRPVQPEDDDLRAAFEELDAEGLGVSGSSAKRPSQGPKSYHQQQEKARQGPPPPPRGLDADLVAAYTILGLSPVATWEDVTTAHKKLLKVHHPDRHAGHEGNMKKATAQSQKIGEAFQKIKKHLGR